jgi:competence protein ComEA
MIIREINIKRNKYIMKKIIGLSLLIATTAFSMSVNELNKASKSELMQIKGVGNSKADAIIKYRKDIPFKVISDVENVKGVGSSLAKNIKNDVYKKSSAKKSTQKESKDLDKTKSKTTTTK